MRVTTVQEFTQVLDKLVPALGYNFCSLSNLVEKNRAHLQCWQEAGVVGAQGRGTLCSTNGDSRKASQRRGRCRRTLFLTPSQLNKHKFLN